MAIDLATKLGGILSLLLCAHAAVAGVTIEKVSDPSGRGAELIGKPRVQIPAQGNDLVISGSSTDEGQTRSCIISKTDLVQKGIDSLMLGMLISENKIDVVCYTSNSGRATSFSVRFK